MRRERRIRSCTVRWAFDAEQGFQRVHVFRATVANMRTRAVLVRRIVPARIQRNHAGGNIFEHGFHQLAAAFEFLHGLLQVARELVDLRAAVAQAAVVMVLNERTSRPSSSCT